MILKKQFYKVLTDETDLVTGRPMRKIRSFAKRSGRITESQKKALTDFWSIHGIEYENKILDLNALFERNAPKNIEIGFGMGENILSVAQSHPDEDFIGIEVHLPAVGNALNKINELQLTNLRVLNHDAVEVFTHQIADFSLNSVSVFFPDPWHKPHHHKRRLISPKFADLLATKIASGGRVYLATDWEHYANQMLEVFSKNNNFKNLSPTKTFCERMEFRPITKFERRGIKLGHGVWDLIFEKS